MHQTDYFIKDSTFNFCGANVVFKVDIKDLLSDVLDNVYVKISPFYYFYCTCLQIRFHLAVGTETEMLTR